MGLRPLLGIPRYTADLDAVFLLSVSDIPRLLELASAEGIEPRIPNAEVFARKNRIVLFRHEASGVDINLSLGILPFEVEMVERSISVQVSGITLRLPTLEDPIMLKAVAHRPKDLEDIKAIAASQPTLDQDRIRFWVEQFGEALDAPNLWELISRFL